MSNPMTLSPVIRINEDKCINCYACITACPVKYCMDGSGEKLTINTDLCIGCGNCIAACSHNARLIQDDTSLFFSDLGKKTKMIAVAAPAAASYFPGRYLNLNGFLVSLGVEKVFDVSFGAELTIISYIEYLREKKPRFVIAQPCPAIVTFIEIYHPELIPYLAPADSPMLHSVKFIREFYPQYNNHKIAVISPCVAKRREFDEAGAGDYNVTFLGLKSYFESRGIDLSSYQAVDYEGPLAERAVQFPAPGGLLDTAERFMPGIRRHTRKIEGVHTVYPYLEEVARLMGRPDIVFPLLVDCLNCEKGCNGGPGTGNCKVALDELETPIRKRSATLERFHNPREKERLYKKLHNAIGRYWKKGLYNRAYRDLSANNTIRRPGDGELKDVYLRLRKYGQADLYDCTACGYGSCKAMATAIFNGLNKPENCAHYNKSLLEEKKDTEEINRLLKEHIQTALGIIDGIGALVKNLAGKVGSQASAIDESSAATEKMVASIKTTSEVSSQKRDSIDVLLKNTGKEQESMRETIDSVNSIAESMDGVAQAIKIISGIAANTNFLSMNAAIEAAHAGDAGKGFSVVAGEIRRLSESTRENSHNISVTLSKISEGISITLKRSGNTNNLINEMALEINGFAKTMTGMINTFSELSSGSSEVIQSLSSLRELTAGVKTSYAEMLSMTENLREAMDELAQISEKKMDS